MNQTELITYFGHLIGDTIVDCWDDNNGYRIVRLASGEVHAVTNSINFLQQSRHHKIEGLDLRRMWVDPSGMTEGVVFAYLETCFASCGLTLPIAKNLAMSNRRY